MSKPIRTRRLSVVAIISLALFLILAVAGIWSFRTTDGWVFDDSRPLIALDGGRLVYEQILSSRRSLGSPFVLHKSSDITVDNRYFARAVWGFRVKKVSLAGIPASIRAGFEVVEVDVPIWPLLLLLLIAPVRWLRAQPANTPAFPVITDTKHGNS